MQLVMSKRLERVLRKWDVHLRTSTSTVTHVVTGKQTELDPLAFAVFEVAMKAVYLCNALSPHWSEMCEAGHDQHYEYIAEMNGIKLPDPAAVSEANREKERLRAGEDYRHCVSLINRLGLYHRLLD